VPGEHRVADQATATCPQCPTPGHVLAWSPCRFIRLPVHRAIDDARTALHRRQPRIAVTP